MFLKSLPKNIEINSCSYAIRTDFRTWITVESILKDINILNEFKLSMIISLCDLFLCNQEITKEDPLDVMDSILAFWRMYKKINHKAKKSNDIAYDYEYDFDLIVSAFRQQYNINLYTAKMHWFEFKSLFDGLNDQTAFKKVVFYRTVELSKVPKEQRKEYAELKEFYRIEKDIHLKKSAYDIEKELLSKVKAGV